MPNTTQAADAEKHYDPTLRRPFPLADRSAWSVDEFCTMYGCGRATAYRWAKLGLIALSKSGGRTFITREAVDAWKARMAAGAFSGVGV